MTPAKPTPAEIERRARYSAYVAARTEADRRDQPMPDDRTIHAAIRAYREAWLPDHDTRIRAQVAAEITVHADRYAGKPLNHPHTRLRRHLLVAARIAHGPLTDDDLARIAAQVVGLTTTKDPTWSWPRKDADA